MMGGLTMPQEFIDYLCNEFGLEWLDYADEQNYNEWLKTKED